MNEQERALVLGGLLHDIGKFEFRTTDRRQRHTSFGDFFVSEYLMKVESLAPIGEEVRRLVAHHHDPEAGDPFLREADHLAAAERQEEKSTETLRSLISVLAGVDIGKGNPPGEVYRYAARPLEFRDPFPERLVGVRQEGWKPDPESTYQEHKDAWEEFCKEVARIPDHGPDAWIETLTHLARKYLSRVVSAAFKSQPDISLYDHGRSVAAIALCLCRAQAQSEPFLLIRGDISGIQKFLYKLASPEEEGGTKRMAKRLRGRSFYVSLLSETVARFFMHRLDLPSTNLLFCGGGHFMILAPNTGGVAKLLRESEVEINRWLFGQLKGDLALVCGTTPADQELLKDFPALMQKSGDDLGKSKSQKFLSILDEKFFEPQRYDETMDVCPVCQADFKKDHFKKGHQTCDLCESHVEVGRQVLRAGYLVRVEGDDLVVPGVAGDFGSLGMYWRLERDFAGVSRLLGQLEGKPVRRVHVDRLNETDFLEEGTQSSARRSFELSFGFRPLGQYAPPDEEGDGPAEFGELAKMGTENYPLLGVVRMDVDSLGAIFATGLGERRSLSRTATLSRELEGFFAGYINTLAEKHRVYITYSGGDDLFVVGSWINALEFGRDLRKDFARFACDNGNVTLSGGILFCKDSFPIGRAAEVAGRLEEEAKSKRGADKNAVAVFGEVVSWERLEKLLEYGDQLLQLVDAKEIPRSFVHQVLQLSQESKGIRTQEEQYLRKTVRNKMRLKYMVARRGATSRAISADQEMGEERRKIGALARLVTEDRLFEELAIPASYVLYHTRKLNHKEN